MLKTLLQFLSMLPLLAACSLKNPQDLAGGLSLKIEKQERSYYSQSDDAIGISSIGPSSINDFNCFAVNVTGPGIIQKNNIGPGCDIVDNMQGQGVGMISDTFAPGTPIELMVTTGKDRRVDVYGISNKSAGYCDNQSGNQPGDVPPPGDVLNADALGGDHGYFVGSRLLDISGPTAITVPVSYSPATPYSVHCKTERLLFRPSEANRIAHLHQFHFTPNTLVNPPVDVDITTTPILPADADKMFKPGEGLSYTLTAAYYLLLKFKVNQFTAFPGSSVSVRIVVNNTTDCDAAKVATNGTWQPLNQISPTVYEGYMQASFSSFINTASNADKFLMVFVHSVNSTCAIDSIIMKASIY